MSKGQHLKHAWLMALLGFLPAGAVAQTDAAPSAEMSANIGPAAFCEGDPQLRVLRGLDFGDVRVASGTSGYVTVMPDGVFLHSGDVLIVREPLPGEMEISGTPDLEIAILIENPEIGLSEDGTRTSARNAGSFLIDSSDMTLDRAEPGRWEGRLGPSGRAVLRFGATMLLNDNGIHGAAAGAAVIDVVAR